MKKTTRKKKIAKCLVTLFGVFYGTALIYIVFFARRRWSPRPPRSLQWVPFRDKWIYLQTGSHRSHENIEFYKDLIGNVLLFIPFTILLYILFNIKRKRTLVLIAFITSFIIESIQYLLNVGVADIDDLILNTTGAVLGIAITRWLPRPFTSPNLEKAC